MWAENQDHINCWEQILMLNLVQNLLFFHPCPAKCTFLVHKKNQNPSLCYRGMTLRCCGVVRVPHLFYSRPFHREGMYLVTHSPQQLKPLPLKQLNPALMSSHLVFLLFWFWGELTSSLCCRGKMSWSEAQNSSILEN